MRVHVTFEFEERQPITTIHSIVASSPAAAAGRAIRLAKREAQQKTRGWTSLVVLVEKGDVKTLTAETQILK